MAQNSENDPIELTPAARDLLDSWLTHLTAIDSASPRTIRAYGTDLKRFFSFQNGYHGDAMGLDPLRALRARDVRAWMASEREQGVSCTVACAAVVCGQELLSLVVGSRKFRCHFAILSARSPKYERNLPRPLPEIAAKQMISQIAEQDDREWVSMPVTWR